MHVIFRLSTIGLVVSAWVAAALFYNDLPDLLPRHWNAFGKADGFTAKPWGPFVLPLTMAAMWLGTPLLKRIAPRRQRIERFPGAFEFRMMLSIGLIFVIWMAVVSQSVSWVRVVAVPLVVGSIVAGIGKVLAARELPSK